MRLLDIIEYGRYRLFMATAMLLTALGGFALSANLKLPDRPHARTRGNRHHQDHGAHARHGVHQRAGHRAVSAVTSAAGDLGIVAAARGRSTRFWSPPGASRLRRPRDRERTRRFAARPTQRVAAERRKRASRARAGAARSAAPERAIRRPSDPRRSDARRGVVRTTFRERRRCLRRARRCGRDRASAGRECFRPRANPSRRVSNDSVGPAWRSNIAQPSRPSPAANAPLLRPAGRPAVRAFEA